MQASKPASLFYAFGLLALQYQQHSATANLLPFPSASQAQRQQTRVPNQNRISPSSTLVDKSVVVFNGTRVSGHLLHESEQLFLHVNWHGLVEHGTDLTKALDDLGDAFGDSIRAFLRRMAKVDSEQQTNTKYDRIKLELASAISRILRGTTGVALDLGLEQALFGFLRTTLGLAFDLENIPAKSWPNGEVDVSTGNGSVQNTWPRHGGSFEPMVRRASRKSSWLKDVPEIIYVRK